MLSAVSSPVSHPQGKWKAAKGKATAGAHDHHELLPLPMLLQGPEPPPGEFDLWIYLWIYSRLKANIDLFDFRL